MDSPGFTVAAYIATFILVGGYTLDLLRRLRRARQGAGGSSAARRAAG